MTSESDKIKILLKLVKSLKYPYYFNAYSGDDYYQDKHIYLISQKISSTIIIYPSFISREDDIDALENKKGNLEHLWQIIY